MNGGTIDKNSAQNGGGVYVNGGKFTMDNGTISNNTAAGAEEKKLSDYDSIYSSGGGVYVNGGDFTMNKGTISGNVAKENAESDNDHATSYLNGNRGGGVYVAKDDKTSDKKKGTFTMNGGTIEQNKAGEGGGIFLEYAPMGVWTATNEFTMKGGTVDSNTAFIGEGGGIYIRGIGEITKGHITNNETLTESDLGGGGVYVEKDGVLTIANAIVTHNFAQGLGAGLAACVHGKTSLVNIDGAAIFGNTIRHAGGEVGYVKNDKVSDGTPIDGTKYNDFIDAYNLWKDDKDFQNAAKDIFTASDSSKGDKDGSTPGTIIGNMMLNGVLANWTGMTYNHGDDNALVQKIINGDAAVYSNRLLGLTANIADGDEYKMNPSVFITGNRSVNTHGGGIANNGTLFLGDVDPSDQFNSDLPELEVNKNLTPNEKPDGDAPVAGIPTDGEFSFNLTAGDKAVGTLKLDIKEMVKGDDGITSSGTTSKFTIDTSNFDVSEFGDNNTKDFSFTVTEYEPTGVDAVNGVTYDKTQYRITVTITKGFITETVGKVEFKVPTYEFVKTLKYEKLNADGTYTPVDKITFNNTYKPDTPEEKPENTESIDKTLPEMYVEKTFEVKQGTPSDQGEFVFDILDKSENGNTLASVTIFVKDCLTDPVRVALPLADAIKALRPDAGKLENTTLFVKERNNNIDGVKYSENMYQIDLNVKESVTDKDDGSTHTVYSYADPVITMFGDSATGDVDGTVLKFVNVYDKPEEPSTPPTTPEKPNEPSTPPTTPDRPSRPTPPPTPEEPTIDIPDDDVPLAPAPEEPEVSIPDEDVPLAGEPPLVELPEPEVPLAPMPPETTTIPDPEVPLAGVPQTGDNAGGFYALMALAACGLVVLNLRKKENEI